MNKLILLAGAALMIGTAPAIAKPGNGQGHGQGAAKVHGNASVKAYGNSNASKADVRARATTRHSARTRHSPLSRRVDRDRDGILDRDEALARKYGGALCPPGLYKKTPACIPPGQAKRDFREGQRLSGNYRYYTPYGDIPSALRDQYGLTDTNRYIYRNNTIYVVDPQTSAISRIIDAVL